VTLQCLVTIYVFMSRILGGQSKLGTLLSYFISGTEGVIPLPELGIVLPVGDGGPLWWY